MDGLTQYILKRYSLALAIIAIIAFGPLYLFHDYSKTTDKAATAIGIAGKQLYYYNNIKWNIEESYHHNGYHINVIETIIPKFKANHYWLVSKTPPSVKETFTKRGHYKQIDKFLQNVSDKELVDIKVILEDMIEEYQLHYERSVKVYYSMMVTCFLILIGVIFVMGKWLIIDLTREVKRSRESERDAIHDLHQIQKTLNEHAIVSMTDVKGTITYANDKMVEISGYSKKELIGSNHRILRSSYHSKNFYKNMWRSLGNGRIWQGEIKNKRKDGSHYWVKATILPFLNEEGKPERYIAIRTDITERKIAEEHIQASETLYRGLHKSLPVGVVLQDKTGTIISINNTATNILGVNGALGKESYGFEWKALKEDGREYHSEEHPAIVSLRTGKPMRDVVMGLERSDGIIWISINSQPLFNSYNDEPYAVITSFVDITDKKRHLEEIEKAWYETEMANKAKSEFLANMSHELRTPLNSIFGFAQMFEMEPYGELAPEYHDYAKNIEQSTEHLLDLINDVLDFSKLEAKAMEITYEPVSVQSLVNNVVTMLRQRATEEKIHITQHLEDITFQADALRLRQILINLLSNAVKFANGNDVVIDVRRRSDQVVFTVIDRGYGMSDDEKAKAINPFVQIGRGEKSKHEGTGLGLPLVKSLVEIHGGIFEIRSKKNKGTIAIAKIPYKKEG